MIKLKQRLRSGISFEETAGQVPEFEAREACIYTNYNWSEWIELEVDERALLIAQYRMHNLIEAHVNDAASRKSEAGSRQGPGQIPRRNQPRE